MPTFTSFVRLREGGICAFKYFEYKLSNHYLREMSSSVSLSLLSNYFDIAMHILSFDVFLSSLQ
jgi:hypothetical protein